jgi:hypothetical protein
MQKHEWKILAGIAIAMAGFLGALVASVSLMPSVDGEDSTPISGKAGTDARVGDTHYIGAANCDKAIKLQLVDPDSFQRVATQIVDVKPGSGWVARTSFRSRNGFGGYREGTADCLFDGSSYRAIVME